MQRCLLPLGAVLLGAALGIGGRWWAGPDPRNEAGTRNSGTPERNIRTTVDRPASHPAYRSADEAWTDLTHGHFGRYATWLMEADEVQVARAWELWRSEHRGLDRDLQPLAGMILVRWAELDPEAMIAAVGRAPKGYAMWARVDFEAAVTAVREWLATPAPQPGTQASGPKPWHVNNINDFLMTVAHFDPGGAMELMHRYPELKTGSGFVEGYISGRADPRSVGPQSEIWNTPPLANSRDHVDLWAAAEPEEALQWIAAGAGIGGQGLTKILRAIRPHDLQELDRLAAILPPGDTRTRFLETHIGPLARRHPDNALALARSQEEFETRRSLVTAIGVALADEDPQRSVALLAEMLRENTHADENPTEDGSTSGPGNPVPPTWLKSLAPNAPEETMELLRDLPEATKETSPGGILAREWLQHDRQGFSDWLKGLERGPTRDAFVGYLVGDLAFFKNDGRAISPDFPEAMLWIERVDSAESRDQLMRQAITRWRLLSPYEAEAFLQTPKATAHAKAVHARLVEEDSP